MKCNVLIILYFSLIMDEAMGTFLDYLENLPKKLKEAFQSSWDIIKLFWKSAEVQHHGTKHSSWKSKSKSVATNITSRPKQNPLQRKENILLRGKNLTLDNTLGNKRGKNLTLVTHS